MTYDVPLTPREYSPNLCYLRQAVVRDRTIARSTVIVSDGFGAAVSLFLRHSDLYITGLQLDGQPFHFDEPGVTPPAGSTPLGFGGDYVSLGLYRHTLRLDQQTLHHAVIRLARHKPGRNGVDLFDDEKRCLIRLIFVIAEALRFWGIHRDVDAVLQSSGSAVTINDYAGHDKPINSWDRWSRMSDWPARGVFVPTQVARP